MRKISNVGTTDIGNVDDREDVVLDVGGAGEGAGGDDGDGGGDGGDGDDDDSFGVSEEVLEVVRFSFVSAIKIRLFSNFRDPNFFFFFATAVFPNFVRKNS